MEIFQFMSIQKVPVLNRLLKKAICNDCIIILDLEDTLDDEDEKKSKSIKDWGRCELKNFAHSFPDFFKNKKIGIRINSIKSNELAKDLEVTAEISKIWDLFCIVAPKIESKESINEIIYYLENKKIHYKTFIPIIETINGVNNLHSIVENKKISYAIYGHNDYSLDSQHWPFLEQDELEFWKIVSCFIKKVEDKGIHYIHPPLPYFLNQNLVFQVQLQLQSRCLSSYGIMTINNYQTTLFNSIKNSDQQINTDDLRSASYTHKEKIDKALYIKNLFSKKKRNFFIDQKTGKFITPHEHISAINFLEKHNA